LTYHRELQVDCNTFFTSFVKLHKAIYIFFYHVFKSCVLRHLKTFSFWSNHVVRRILIKGMCLMELCFRVPFTK